MQRIQRIRPNTLISTTRGLLILSWCFLCIHKLASLSTLSLDNDHFTVFDHVYLTLNGSLWPSDWIVSRLPSYFPDYVLTAIISPFTHAQLSPASAIYAYSFIASFIIALLISHIPKAFRLKNHKRLSLLTLFVLNALLIVPGFSLSSAIATLPINHGGNCINTLASICITGYLINSSTNSQKRLLRNTLFALVFVSTLSNRLYLVSFSFPLLTSIWILIFWGSLSSRIPERLLTKTVLLGTSLGIGIYYILKRWCEDPGVSAISNKDLHAKLAFLNSNGISPLIAASLLMSAFSVYNLFRSRRKQPSDSEESKLFLTVFLMLSLTAGIGTYFVYAPDSSFVYLRYFLPQILIASFLLTIAIPGNLPNNLFVSIGFLASTVACAILSFINNTVTNSPHHLHLDEKHFWATQKISRFFPSSRGISTSPDWESRILSWQNKTPGFILAVSSDGNPRIFPHSREEYLKHNLKHGSNKYKPSSHDIVDFKFALVGPSTWSSLLALLQRDGERIACMNNSDYCIWSIQNSSSLKAQHASFFSTQADDKWRCVNRSDNPLHTAAHALKRLLK